MKLNSKANHNTSKKEEGGRKKGEGKKRKWEGGRRKEEGGRRKGSLMCKTSIILFTLPSGLTVKSCRSEGYNPVRNSV